jgi:hypothetical protein
MARIALLIGVSEYGENLSMLPCATRDVTALQELLEDPNIGNFDDVKALLNPDTQEMAKAIEKMFKECTKEDFVLLFFSGHGVQDDSGKLFFAARNTQKQDDKVYEADTVAAGFVHSQMESSRSRQIVVILNCCFSGAFSSGLIPQSVGTADVSAQLGGRGRAILTSCNAVQLSFEGKDAELSIYSQFLVEGLKTGEADRDRDGRITVDELHEYVSKRVKDSGFAMNPQNVSQIEESLSIAHAPIQDKGKRYEAAVMLFSGHGTVSKACRTILKGIREELAISSAEAKAIESAVLRSQKKYCQNLYLYRQEFLTIAQSVLGVTEGDRQRLKQLQQMLKLKLEDVTWVEAAALQTLKNSRRWLHRLKWLTLIPIIPFAITSATTVGIYFRVYEKLPESIQEPFSPFLEQSHRYLHETVDDARQKLAVQIIGSGTNQIWTDVQMSQLDVAIVKAIAARDLAQKQTEWSKSKALWNDAIAQWQIASQWLAQNQTTHPPAFLQALSQHLGSERQKAQSEVAYGQAVSDAMSAANLSKKAKTQAEWQAIAQLWQQAKEQMEAVQSVSDHYQLAQLKKDVYADYHQIAQKQANPASRTVMNK